MTNIAADQVFINRTERTQFPVTATEVTATDATITNLYVDTIHSEPEGGAINIHDPVIIINTLQTAGGIQSGGALDVLAGGSSIFGNSTFHDDLSVVGNLTVNGISTLSGNVTTLSNLVSNGTAFINGSPAMFLPTTGGTPSDLNYYEDLSIANVVFTGPWAATQQRAIRLVRLGRDVVMKVNAIIQNYDHDAAISVPVGTIPSRFAPPTSADSVLTSVPTVVINNGSPNTGYFSINNNGQFFIYNGIDAIGNFTTGSSAGFTNITAKWTAQ